MYAVRDTDRDTDTGGLLSATSQASLNTAHDKQVKKFYVYM